MYAKVTAGGETHSLDLPELPKELTPEDAVVPTVKTIAEALGEMHFFGTCYIEIYNIPLAFADVANDEPLATATVIIMKKENEYE